MTFPEPNTFKEKFLEVCKKLFQFGLEEHEKREEEVNMFWKCVNEAKVENKQLEMAAIDEYITEKEKVSLPSVCLSIAF